MELILTNNKLVLRSITEEDHDLLSQIYSSTRLAEMELITDWDSIKKTLFLRSQFLAQHTYYQNNYKGAFFWMIEYNGQTIGRLYIHPNYGKNSVRIIDITLLPEWRGQGIGKQILLDVMDFAEGLGRSVTIHVESFNPAMHLYKKIGFTMVDVTNGVYNLLEWKAKVPVLQ